MATLSGSDVSVWGFTTPGGPRANGSGNLVYNCYVAAYFSGTYVQGDNAHIQNVHTAIAGSLRDGSTITLVDAAFAGPGNEAGTVIGAKTVAVSTNDITMELTGSDLSTEHAGAALGAMTEPIAIFVSYVKS